MCVCLSVCCMVFSFSLLSFTTLTLGKGWYCVLGGRGGKSVMSTIRWQVGLWRGVCLSLDIDGVVGDVEADEICSVDKSLVGFLHPKCFLQMLFPYTFLYYTHQKLQILDFLQNLCNLTLTTP